MLQNKLVVRDMSRQENNGQSVFGDHTCFAYGCTMRKHNLVTIVVFMLTTLLTDCTTLRLERNLNPHIREWYELHAVLMESKIPWYMNVIGHEDDGTVICDHKTISEQLYFLRLSEELQRKYISVFWEMRIPGLDEVFYSRVEAANEIFDDEGKIGWKTDRGRIFIIVGEPDYIYVYNRYRAGLPSDSDLTGGYIQQWSYYSRANMAVYYFCWKPPAQWERCVDRGTLSMASSCVRFEKECKAFFAPTEEGWMLWDTILDEYR